MSSVHPEIREQIERAGTGQRPLRPIESATLVPYLLLRIVDLLECTARQADTVAPIEGVPVAEPEPALVDYAHLTEGRVSDLKDVVANCGDIETLRAALAEEVDAERPRNRLVGYFTSRIDELTEVA
jgi:hypothetical protein